MRTTGDLTEARKNWIDNMTLVEMLKIWRFSPIGSFQRGDPVSDYFQKVMMDHRAAEPWEWVQASKNVGW